MADRIADNADVLVDEMKRKARRRLVGAIVLALAAAVILPLLLEKEPRPRGDDVSVQIPPVDDGKFVNRLTGTAGEAKALPKTGDKSLPKADDKVDSKSTPAKSEPKPDAAVATVTPASTASGTISAPPPASGEASQPKNPAVVVDPRASTPAANAESQPAPASEARIEPKSAAPNSKMAANAPTQLPSATPPVAPVKADGFVVQLAAFADDKGANALANKLKKVGYAAYVEPVQTSRGTLWRVRVGGYGSRSEADAARAKLKGEGYSGIVAPSK